MKIAQHDWVRRSFSRIGAEVRFQSPSRWSRRFSVDIDRVGRKERFVIQWSNEVEYLVADVQPELRHLLLMVKDPEVKEVANSKVLCGHDERHFFAASIPESAGATTVRTAMTALKPKELLQVESYVGIKPQHLHSRRRRLRNGAKIYRQGEFMFVPRPDYVPPEPLGILRDEILTRVTVRAERWRGSGSGNPHIAREAYRQFGTPVYVCWQHPEGLTEEERLELFSQDPAARNFYWRYHLKDPDVYVRGTIRHPEHATIDLGRVWHRVYVNTEGQAHGRHLSFVD
jgi:hypothetical protein